MARSAQEVAAETRRSPFGLMAARCDRPRRAARVERCPPTSSPRASAPVAADDPPRLPFWQDFAAPMLCQHAKHTPQKP